MARLLWYPLDLTTVLRFPLLSDKTGRIARDYGVLLEDEGVALCGSDWKPGQMMAGRGDGRSAEPSG